MINEKIDEAKRKLKYFLDNNIPVHITEYDGTWHNGLLKEIDEGLGLVVIVDRVTGMDIIPIEKINPDTIAVVKEK